MNRPLLRWIIVSQTLAVVAAGVILPFFIVYLQEATNSYSLFAYLYATFTLAAALTHIWAGRIAARLGVRWMLVIGCIGAGLALLTVPSLTDLWQLYAVQVVLGICLSLQKTGEKVAVASAVRREELAEQIGRYHAVVAVATALMLVVVGWSLDTFSLSVVFYAMAALLIVAGGASVNIRGGIHT